MPSMFLDLSEVPDGSPGGTSPSTARVWLGAAHSDFASGHNLGALSTGLVINTAGVPSSVAHGTNGQVLTMVGGSPAWAAASGGGAPTSAQYLTLALDATLSAERVLVVTSGHLTLSDGGANGNATLGLPSVGGGSAVGGALSLITTVTPDAQGRVSSMAAVAGTANQVARINSGGTSVGFATLVDANIDAAAAIAHSKLASLAGLSLLGRSANSTGAMAAITASSDGQFPRHDGSAITFGQLRAGSAAGTQTNGFVLTLSGGVPTWTAPSGAIDGSGSANRLAVWSDADTLTSFAGVSYTDTNHTLAIAHSTATSTAGTFQFTITNNAGQVLEMGCYGNTTAGTHWGVARASQQRIFADGSGFGMLFGTLSNMPLVIGTNDTPWIRVEGNGNIGYFAVSSAPNYQSGVGVVYVGNRTTAPTGNPSGGFFFYGESGQPTFRDDDGIVTTL